MDDGVQYLSPVEDRWGEIAVYPELMAEYAERLRSLIRRVWVDEPPGGHVSGTAICLSCLLEAGRYGDLIELLACARRKWWYWHRFGAEALARQGAWVPRSPTPIVAARRKVTTTARSIAIARMC